LADRTRGAAPIAAVRAASTGVEIGPVNPGRPIV